MGTGSTTKTDLYYLHNYVQNTMITFPKERFIESLREFFSKDSYYHYVRDPWGFNKTPDHTDLDPRAGLNDDLTTRVFIGEQNRYDIIFYPALIVRCTNSRSVPISMNRDKGSVQWTAVKYMDGYGNETIRSTPSHFIQTGAWEGQITIDIKTRSLHSRDELAQLVSLGFVDTMFDDMKNSGVVIKPGISIGGFSDAEDRNDKLFTATITCEIRTEWRRHIPILNYVDVINFCIEFADLRKSEPIVAPNLGIHTSIQLIDALVDL